MKKIFLIIIAAVVVLSVSLLVFINSPSFLEVTVNFINTHTGLHVELGSLSFAEGNRIIIKDLVIEEKKKDGFHLILPYAGIRASLKGIFRKNIEEIILVRPKLSFIYQTDKKGKTFLPFTFNKVSVNDADVTLQIGKGKSFHIHPITISLDKLPNGKDAELRGSAFISELGSTVSLTAEIVTGELNTPEVRGEISLRGVDIEKLSQTLFHDFLRQKGLNLKGNGDLQVVLKAAIPENSPPHISGAAYLNLSNAGFSYSDESMVGEGIEMKVSGNFGFSLPADRVDFSLYSEAANFEFLSGGFYGNFRDKVLGFSAKGAYSRVSDSLNITESKTSLTDTGDIFISGNISGLATSPVFNADIKLDNLPNREVYNFFIRETFQEQYPLFSQLEVNGESSMRLSVSGTPKYFSVRGEVNIASMNILGNSPDKALKEINIHLPVDLSYPQDSYTGGRAVFGFLKMKSLSWSALKLKDIEIFPSVRHNAVLFKEDIKLPVMGGDIVLKNILYSDIFSPEKQLRLSVDIQGIDLEQASTAMTWPRFSGRLSGVIPMVNLADNHLITDGKIILELFGGKIKVSNLSVDNVFGPVSSLKSSIELEEIDLGKLTGAFDFGHISGIIRGAITDLVIVKGQAEGFKVSLETYKKKGVEQKISVEALKKISILGTGSSTSILDRGIYQFFKEYRYDKLGFKAFLKNDNLLLLGIENEGNREYLVKGGIFPPKVDVISYTQNISFQEMVNRLKRIKPAEK
jgi:hypothetical protein